MDAKTRNRIADALCEIPDGDIVPLKGSANLLRLRIGKYRVVFSYQGDVVLVDKIESRGGVYKGGLKRW